MACIFTAIGTSIGIAVKSYKTPPSPVSTRSGEKGNSISEEQQKNTITLKYVKPTIEDVGLQNQ